jgi:hypothetical protein
MGCRRNEQLERFSGATTIPVAGYGLERTWTNGLGYGIAYMNVFFGCAKIKGVHFFVRWVNVSLCEKNIYFIFAFDLGDGGTHVFYI